MKNHNYELLKTVLNNLTTLGFTKKINEEAFPLWSDALEDLTDKHLMAGYDVLKKRGMDKTFNTANFRKICKEAYTARDEHKIVDPNKQLVCSINPNITAAEWIKRIANRESTYINSLPQEERSEEYKNAEYAISKHSSLLTAMVQNKKMLEKKISNVEENFENGIDSSADEYLNLLNQLEDNSSTIGDLQPILKEEMPF